MYRNNFTDIIENQEVIQKLINNGYGDVIECLLANEAKCYTKKARLNKSATCRELGCKNKELEDALRNMRALVEKDFGLEE